VSAEQGEEVAPVLLGQQGVEVGVGTRVERVKKHQQDLRVWNIDQGVSCNSCKTEESNRGPTGEVCEHEQCHPFSHGSVGLGCGRVVATDREINASITRAYQDKRQTVNQKQAHEVDLVAQVAIFHRQANAEKKGVITLRSWTPVAPF
jgi:hypothetical protein